MHGRIQVLAWTEQEQQKKPLAWYMQVLAWSGVGLDTYAVTQPNGSRAIVTGSPDELPESIAPPVPILFRRQVATDNTSMVLNTTFVPQVC